jgi:hypothetical protein
MQASVEPKTPTNIPRRAIGVALCFAPLAALLASLAVGITHPQTSRFAGAGFMIAAAVIALVNATLRGSGVPILGTLLLCMGVLDGFGATGSGVIGLAAFVLDTGGSGWFVLSTWHDRGFWDGESSKPPRDT